MFRRSNGRPPPIVLGGLLLFIVILTYSYWSLNMHNNDTLSQLETLQASLKIRDVQMEQNEKKMSALQDQLHNKEETISDLKLKLNQQESDIRTFNSGLQRRDTDITRLKGEIRDLQEKLELAEEKATECQGENERLMKESDLVISQRDDAVSALNNKESELNSLNEKLAKLESTIRELKAGASVNALGELPMSARKPSSPSSPILGVGDLAPVKTRLAVQSVDKGLQGLKFHGSPVLYRDPPNAHRPKPRFSVLNDIANGGQNVADDRNGAVVAQPALGANNKNDGAEVGVAPKPAIADDHVNLRHDAEVNRPPSQLRMGGQPELNVLPEPINDALPNEPLTAVPSDHLQAPPIHDAVPANSAGAAPGHLEPRDVLQPPPDFDNLDAAIDEGNQFGEDPLMPDQDPEGDDVADSEKLLQDHRVHENRVHDDGGVDYNAGAALGRRARMVPLAAAGQPNDEEGKMEGMKNGVALDDGDVIDEGGVLLGRAPEHNENHGGEVDAAIKYHAKNNDANGQDAEDEGEDDEDGGEPNENFAKENFFEEDPNAPVRLYANKNNDNSIDYAAIRQPA